MNTWKEKTFSTIKAFWDVTPCTFVERYRRFGGTYQQNCNVLHPKRLLDIRHCKNPNLTTSITILLSWKITQRPHKNYSFLFTLWQHPHVVFRMIGDYEYYWFLLSRLWRPKNQWIHTSMGMIYNRTHTTTRCNNPKRKLVIINTSVSFIRNISGVC